jgi:hypothetical protein
MKLRSFNSLLLTVLVASTALLPVTVSADGSATFSLVQSGKSISVYEDSGSVAVNTVEADFSYDNPGAVQSITATPGGTFGTCTSTSINSIVCTALGGNITGSNLVATLNFATTATASVGVSMLSSSMILASADSSDVSNHAALPSTTFSYTAPVVVAKPVTPVKTTPAPTPAPVTPAPKPVKKPAPVKKAPVHQASKRSWYQNSAFTSSTVLLLFLLAAGFYWAVLRRRNPVVVPVDYKVNKKSKAATPVAQKSVASKSAKAKTTRTSTSKSKKA